MNIKQKIAEMKETRAEKQAERETQEEILETLGRIKEYCAGFNLGYYPVLIDALPDYADAVNGYISHKARTELNPSQFEKNAEIKRIGDMMEVGGVLEYSCTKNALRDITFSKPVSKDGRIFDNPSMLNLEHILSNGRKISSCENLIGWYSQTIGGGNLSGADAENMVAIKKVICDKPYFQVVYSTRMDRCFWYGLEELSAIAPVDAEIRRFVKLIDSMGPILNGDDGPAKVI